MMRPLEGRVVDHMFSVDHMVNSSGKQGRCMPWTQEMCKDE